jgi:microsomal epoxide hydrolase
VESRFTKDELLTTVMIYWATETIGSTLRGYYEGYHTPSMPWRKGRVNVPMGASLFANDYVFPHPHPRELAGRLYNIQRWTIMPTGGHFAASEEPRLLAEEIRAFFRPLRADKSN